MATASEGLLVTIVTFLAITCLLCVAIYRISFHPLAKYPGPLFGRVTDWYSVYHSRKGDRHLEFYELHHQYGDVVRYGPNRISINTNAALHEIYGTKSNVQKSKFYDVFRAFFEVPGSITLIDKVQHGFRRRITSQALTISAIKSMEGLILDNIRNFCEQIITLGGHGSARKTSDDWSPGENMTEWLARLTFDIVGDLCFGRKWNVTSSERNRSFLEAIPEGTAGLLLAGHMPAILTLKVDRIFFRKLTDSARKFEDMAKWQTSRRIGAHNEEEVKHDDIFEKLLEARDPNTGEGLTTSDLNAEAIGLIVAGSDTMATTMTATLFYLLHHRPILNRLYNEIDDRFSSVEDIVMGPELNSCHFLRACLDETMRLSPPVGGILPREVLQGGIIIDDNFFPEGTDIGTPIYALHRQEKYFHKASSYEPQRWMVDKSDPITEYGDVSLAYSAFQPFSLGPRGCPGKGLAYAEMMVTVARMVHLFEMRLVDDGESVRLGEKGEIGFLTWDSFTSTHDGPRVQFRTREKRKE
ncbi:MAG: hypothetical protein Q9219_007485 [cf. Caloplaca sp. 3 TL-2023]